MASTFGSRRRISFAVLLGSALISLTACSTTTTVTKSSTNETVTTATPVPTAAVATTIPETIPQTSAPPVAGCPDETAPGADALSVAAIEGDWNGDGQPDSAVSWGTPSGGGAQWFVRAEVTGGSFSTIALGDLGAGYAQVLDRVDVDFSLGAEPGVNRDEIVAIAGGGAATLNLGIFGVGADGCIFQFDNGGGLPFEAPVGATVVNLSGFRCDGGGGSQFVVLLRATTADDVNWSTFDDRIERVGDRSLVVSATIEGNLPAGDAALQAYSQAGCGGTIWL